jgi:hypothetical protein
MPFQISELVIRVTGETAHKPGTECRKGGSTCMPPTPDPGTTCRHGGTTCMPPTPDPGTTCRHGGTTCKPGAPDRSQPAKHAELEFVLQQIRDTVATETADDEALVTA